MSDVIAASENPKIYMALNSTALVAHYGGNDWWIFPGCAGGFQKGRRWNPSPAVAERVLHAHNGHEHIYHAKLHFGLVREWMGITDKLPEA